MPSFYNQLIVFLATYLSSWNLVLPSSWKLISFLCWIPFFWIQYCILSWFISLFYWVISSYSFLSKGPKEIILNFHSNIKMAIFCPQSRLIFWLGIEFSDIDNSKYIFPLFANISFRKFVVLLLLYSSHVALFSMESFRNFCLS